MSEYVSKYLRQESRELDDVVRSLGLDPEQYRPRMTERVEVDADTLDQMAAAEMRDVPVYWLNLPG